jgi:hypothetical protein
MSVTADDVNFLVYRYLQESGACHTWPSPAPLCAAGPSLRWAPRAPCALPGRLGLLPPCAPRAPVLFLTPALRGMPTTRLPAQRLQLWLRERGA